MFCLIPALLAALVVGVAPASLTPSPRSRPPLHVYRGVAPEYEALLTAPERRLRATDVRMQALIAEGIRRSPTFARLLGDLEKTDLIAYVERIQNMPAAMSGRLLFVSASPAQRYVRIQLGTGGTNADAIVTLAHELQHAIEVGTSPDVRDQEALARLYQRIGQNSLSGHTYDTVAAQSAGKLVRRELEG
jgi:hypothetical protein